MKDPNQPYEYEVDGDGLNTDLAPTLIETARALGVHASVFDRPVRVETPEDEDQPFRIERRETPCVRCVDDDVVIWPDNVVERIGHLTREHGYRMDGHRYDNANQVMV